MDEKREMQKILNHSLSGLKENPFLAQRVIAQAKGEKPVVKKISASMILVIVILCLTLTAIAAGIIYNQEWYWNNRNSPEKEYKPEVYGELMEKDGKYIRVVTLPDDRTRQLYMDLMTADDPGEAYEAYHSYAWSLPVSYVEKITAQPKEQAELDALAGKTVGELEKEGYEIYGSGGGTGLPTTVDLTYGFFDYEFEAMYNGCYNLGLTKYFSPPKYKTSNFKIGDPRSNCRKTN